MKRKTSHKAKHKGAKRPKANPKQTKIWFEGMSSRHVQAKGHSGISYPWSHKIMHDVTQAIKWLNKHKHDPYCKLTSHVLYTRETPSATTTCSSYGDLYEHDVSTLDVVPACICEQCVPKDEAKAKALAQEEKKEDALRLTFFCRCSRHIQEPAHGPDDWNHLEEALYTSDLKDVVAFLDRTKAHATCTVQAKLRCQDKIVRTTSMYCRDPSTERLVPACVCQVCNPEQKWRLAVSNQDTSADTLPPSVAQRPWCVGIYAPQNVIDPFKGQWLTKTHIRKMQINDTSIKEDVLLLFDTRPNEVLIYLSKFKDIAGPLKLDACIAGFDFQIDLPQRGSKPVNLG